MKMRFYIIVFLLLTGCLNMLYAQPVNDNPCGAISLTVNTTCTLQAASTAGATNTTGVTAPGCGSIVKDVWFKFVVPASGMFTIETTSGTILDGMLAIYTGPCTSLTFAYCDDDSGPGLMPLLDMTGFIPGSTVYVRFSKKAGGTGTFNICVWDDNPPLGNNTDCNTAQQLCTTVSFSSNSLDGGDVDDLTGSNSGCLTPNEHQSSWYYFTFSSPGELNFTIDPINDDDNYNFAVWGPDLVCPLHQAPIRCSYANEDGPTGINTSVTDLTEGVPGDGWVKFINVNAGETYILMIDNYSESGEGFTFTFDGPPDIGCTTYVLPIELGLFSGTATGSSNSLLWSTYSEINNDHFIIEHAENPSQFYQIGEVNGAGNSTVTNDYSFEDAYPYSGTTYYRLKQVNYNGNFTYSPIIEVENLNAPGFHIYPNPSHGKFSLNFDIPDASSFQIDIIDATGIIIYSKSGVATSGEEFLELSIPVKGIFTVLLKTKDRTEVQRLVNY